ncbi:hypothetical protein A1QQ_04635 [Vibrio ordalii FF-167]|nr:hypothetical protein A1QQ_04635 [Vibrio ordalii FF-167]
MLTINPLILGYIVELRVHFQQICKNKNPRAYFFVYMARWRLNKSGRNRFAVIDIVVMINLTIRFQKTVI